MLMIFAVAAVITIYCYVMEAVRLARNFILNEPVPRFGYGFLLGILIAHTIFVVSMMQPAGGYDYYAISQLPPAYVASFLIYLVVVVIATLPAREAMRLLLLAVYPIAIVSLLFAVFPGAPVEEPSCKQTSALCAHMLISLAAYAVLMLALIQAIMTTFIDVRLRKHHSIGIVQSLPPLESMNAGLIQILLVGFGALTLSIAIGFIFLFERIFKSTGQLHVWFSFAAWMIYALILGSHYFLGLRTKVTTHWTLLAFGLLVVGYAGTRIVFQ